MNTVNIHPEEFGDGFGAGYAASLIDRLADSPSGGTRCGEPDRLLTVCVRSRVVQREQ
jgi:hypothetical protein